MILQSKTNIKGLQLLVNTSIVSIPTTSVPVIKAGIEYTNASTKLRVLANLRTFLVEHNLTHLARSDLLVGYNFVLDSRVQNLEKYDFGLTWEAAQGAMIGVKHESMSKEHL